MCMYVYICIHTHAHAYIHINPWLLKILINKLHFEIYSNTFFEKIFVTIFHRFTVFLSNKCSLCEYKKQTYYLYPKIEKSIKKILF